MNCRRCRGTGDDAEGNPGRCAMCRGSGRFVDLFDNEEETP